MLSPLEQFDILILLLPTILFFNVFSIPFSISSLFILINIILVIGFLAGPLVYSRFVPFIWQTLVEFLYKFVLNIVDENSGKIAYKYFSLLFTIFIFILFSNLIGLIPYGFTVTSHIILTFCIAFSMFVGITILGFKLHKLVFFSLFFPSGTPAGLAGLIVGIEVISYLSRPISLSIRLCANMIAGHILLKIVASFIWTIFFMLTKTFSVIIAGIIVLIPMSLLLVLIGLELAIAFLQAYVYVLLLCIYLNEGLHLH